MIRFIGDLLPCIILTYIFLTKRKTYSLVLLITFGFNLLNIHVLHINLDKYPVITFIFALLLSAGIILFYKDYKKNKKA